MSLCVSVMIGTVFWLGYALAIRKDAFNLAERSRKYANAASAKAASGWPLRQFRVLSESINRERCEQEMSECLAYIQNAIKMGRDRNMSRELLLEEMADISPLLQSTFWEMSRHLRLCEVESAEEVFCRRLDQDFARDIAKFFTEWERIPPQELLVTVEAYRDLLLQRRRTRQRRRDEWISDLAYFPVVINAMVVLLNFIYVAYFIEQREFLMGIL